MSISWLNMMLIETGIDSFIAVLLSRLLEWRQGSKSIFFPVTKEFSLPVYPHISMITCFFMTGGVVYWWRWWISEDIWRTYYSFVISYAIPFEFYEYQCWAHASPLLSNNGHKSLTLQNVFEEYFEIMVVCVNQTRRNPWKVPLVILYQVNRC